MNLRSMSMLVAGVTLLYTGVLTCADNLYAGVAVMIIGALVGAEPTWTLFRRFRGQAGGWPRSSRPGEKGGRPKTHLKVVKGKKEERRTYH